jgi:hypothetical protein
MSPCYLYLSIPPHSSILADLPATKQSSTGTADQSFLDLSFPKVCSSPIKISPILICQFFCNQPICQYCQSFLQSQFLISVSVSLPPLSAHLCQFIQHVHLTISSNDILSVSLCHVICLPLPRHLSASATSSICLCTTSSVCLCHVIYLPLHHGICLPLPRHLSASAT